MNLHKFVVFSCITEPKPVKAFRNALLTATFRLVSDYGVAITGKESVAGSLRIILSIFSGERALECSHRTHSC